MVYRRWLTKLNSELYIKKVVFFLILSVSIKAYFAESRAADESEISPQRYVAEILNLMKQHAITKSEVDWEEVSSKVNDLSKNAKSIKETYPAIKYAFKLLGTNHTSLRSVNGKLAAYHSDLKCGEVINTAVPNLTNIGYVRVNSFSSQDPWEKDIYAFALQRKIAEQDRKDLLGWIVDLRWNSGGNMWPMIAGIGPLLGNGTYGYFINEAESSWGYQNGASVVNGHPKISVESPYNLLNSNPKIAVLSSQKVASSGEATLISFKGRENIRFFGSNSCGQSTSNRTFVLSDGSRLNLTTSTMADKNRKLYGGVVNVDELVPQHKVIDVAVRWLNSQP